MGTDYAQLLRKDDLSGGVQVMSGFALSPPLELEEEGILEQHPPVAKDVTAGHNSILDPFDMSLTSSSSSSYGRT